MNLEQRRREVRKYTQIRRTYNLEESTMAQARNKISKIASKIIINLGNIPQNIPCSMALTLRLVILITSSKVMNDVCKEASSTKRVIALP